MQIKNIEATVRNSINGQNTSLRTKAVLLNVTVICFSNHRSLGKSSFVNTAFNHFKFRKTHAHTQSSKP